MKFFSPADDCSFEQTAVRVSNISIAGNTALTIFKLFAGFAAHSGAMVSDAVHSASDVLSSFIVIIGVKLASKESDEAHPYGHEKFESVAAIILAFILCFTGLFIGHTAIEKLRAMPESGEALIPGVLALVAAAVSIIVKEAMYHYTRRIARKIGSTALMAEAWHHRSDALSSVGSLIGIAGARLGQIWFDPVASLFICGFIVKAAVNIFSDAIEKMVDHSCSEELRSGIVSCARQQPGVIDVKSLRTREFGNKAYVEIEILADGNISLKEGSRIADAVHAAVEQKYKTIKHITVRAVPADD